MEKIACNIKLSKEEKKLAKEKKKAETLQKFLNKPKFKNNVDKKITIKVSDKTKVDISTPVGTKKDVERELPKTYCPLYTEEGWHSWWEAQGYFRPEYNEKKSNEKFVIMIPPPNVTGILHIGHALTISIEDTIVRWNRMLGKQTLWLPGTDHAGIATQTVVEKKILRERNQTRHDLGRDRFVEEIWRWKQDKGNQIIDQLKQLGSSCDFTRLRFTMDASMNRAVVETFIRLHGDGLIYRSKRLVNWSCSLRSAISDIEVEKIEIAKRTFITVPGYERPIEFGTMSHFAYRVIGTGTSSGDEEEKIFVGTTRLETMLGDTAIAVHPDDDRYWHLQGRFARHPFVADRSIPIICDEFVDREFGTGAVKITPAHDHNDYEVGMRHGLQFVTVFTDDGRVCDGYGEFSGMKRFDARRAVEKRLVELGLFDRTTDNAMVIPVCSKSKDIIEPMIKRQWYLRCQDMASEALRVVRDGTLKLLPEGVHDLVWQRWMEDCHDWCISRQLWWGHRIPMYRVVRRNEAGIPENGKKESEEYKVEHDQGPEEDWIAARSEQEALELARQKYGRDSADVTVEQDPDVLDTWFSSQLFPFATLGWPDQTADLEKFYPGNLLETGHDIIFFWVARMVMIGLKMMKGRLPFDTVYLHAMIRDAHGRKMSKSLGNVLNPYDIIHGITLEALQAALEHGNLDQRELTQARATQAKDFPQGIPQCGTDALRFALLAYTSQARDINLDVLRVKGYRNFCNKIWQAFKFCQMFSGSISIDEDSDRWIENRLEKKETNDNKNLLSSTDQWILSCLAMVVKEMNEHFGAYNFSAATTSIYRFWLYEFCDVYIEYAKPFRLSSEQGSRKSIIARVLWQCIDVGLRLLHPIMPFITEELFQRLPDKMKRNSDCKQEEKMEDEQPQEEESIMVSPYPDTSRYSQFHQPDIDRNMDLAMETVRKIRSFRKERSMLDKQTLSISYRSIDVDFCRDFVDDVILPLSNCRLSNDYCQGDNSVNSGEGSVLIFENSKLKIFTAIDSSESAFPGGEDLFCDRLLEQMFTVRTTEEQKRNVCKQLRFVDCRGVKTELEIVLVKQWCNWLNGQATSGAKMAVKDTLDFVNERLTKETFLAGSKTPTIADGLLWYYLDENKVSEALLGKYANVRRWHETVKNYQ